MRSLTPIWIGIIAFLGIVSGTLWSKLSTERQLNADLEARIALARIAPSEPAPVQQTLMTTEGNAIPAPVAEPPQSRPVYAEPVPVAVPGTRPHIDTNSAYLQSDMTARARAQVWMGRLSVEGRALTPAQAEALNAAAVAELRRETDETAALVLNPGRTDAVSAAQAKLDFIDRQNETNRRILDGIAPKLTAQQLDGPRTQFDAWYAGAKASARVELERAAGGPMR